ncbi:hypothetical protein Anacy_3394 [Anabaena cylindrica PCC 7122]|uniref:Uncharacterized protein n=1 Tax=Anabaena cylindrica (strain ATCC 27899 / PCC 7122) TaxID=272123 RepID=K9ZJT6_ANACC|nr:hypothetical protein Anacy_3394 [Anabaena cylindrica PCC 7122]BAY04193.1 hypothetical protein NIES19_34550 [Anabaena cylindrica PCC 7122]
MNYPYEKIRFLIISCISPKELGIARTIAHPENTLGGE